MKQHKCLRHVGVTLTRQGGATNLFYYFQAESLALQFEAAPTACELRLIWGIILIVPKMQAESSNGNVSFGARKEFESRLEREERPDTPEVRADNRGSNYEVPK